MLRNVYEVCLLLNECTSKREECMYFFIPRAFALHFILML